MDASLNHRLLSEEGRKEIVKDYETIANKLGDFKANIKDKFNNTKLTKEQRIKIKEKGLKQSFEENLKNKGISADKIQEIMNDDYINSILTLSDESFQESPASSKSKTIEALGVISVTASKKSFVEHMVDLVEVGSESVNKLVEYIGEDNAIGAIMVLQVALEGAPKALLSLAGEEILNTVKKPVVDKVSTIIDEKALKTQEIVNKEKKEAYENFSDVLAEFGFDVALGGAYSTIRSAKKVDKASITKGDKGTVEESITLKIQKAIQIN